MTHELAVARTTEEGRANLDKWGYTVHEDFLTASELAQLRERLEEQAELERDAGVAICPPADIPLGTSTSAPPGRVSRSGTR